MYLFDRHDLTSLRHADTFQFHYCLPPHRASAKQLMSYRLARVLVDLAESALAEQCSLYVAFHRRKIGRGLPRSVPFLQDQVAIVAAVLAAGV